MTHVQGLANYCYLFFLLKIKQIQTKIWGLEFINDEMANS